MSPRCAVSTLLLLALTPIGAGLAGCGGGNAASHVLKTPELPTDKQAKCRVTKSQSEPLIVEWPDAARARLESMTRKGLVVVRYEGCELSVLSRCSVKREDASYSYTPVTRRVNKETIRDADELYMKLPIGAINLEGKLQSAGQLEVQMTTVGRWESSATSVSHSDLEGDCAHATHVIQALTVGAFTFSAGAGAEVSGGAGVGGAGGEAKSVAARELLQKDGDETACLASSATDTTPPEGCAGPFQIEVMPLATTSRGASPAPAPSAGDMTASALECAPGQHPWRGRCVDDEPPSEPVREAPQCVAGTHLEDGECVADTMPAQEPPRPYEGGRPDQREAPNPVRTLLGYSAIGFGLTAMTAGYIAIANGAEAAKRCDEAARTCGPEYESLRSKAITAAIIADVSLGVTALSLLGLWLVPSKVKVSVTPTTGGVFAGAGGQFR